MDFLTFNARVRAIALIVVGLLAWGVFHAIGAYRMNDNPWRALVVLGFSLSFIVFWMALLAWRAGRTK
jgi:ABC-type antimicrobial peptide transport system permease subunit